MAQLLGLRIGKLIPNPRVEGAAAYVAARKSRRRWVTTAFAGLLCFTVGLSLTWPLGAMALTAAVSAVALLATNRPVAAMVAIGIAVALPVTLSLLSGVLALLALVAPAAIVALVLLKAQVPKEVRQVAGQIVASKRR